MDVGSLATTLAQSNVTTGVSLSVLKSVENLDQAVVNRLFASIGLGGAVNTLA